VRAVRRLAVAGVAAAALALVVAAAFGGVALVNYDTLYGLLWGREIATGGEADLRVGLAPTPHPLLTAAGTVLAPLGPEGAQTAAVAGAYLALGAVGVLVALLGRAWFSWPVGLLAAALLLTREPVLSYGVRAYVDLPYLALLLAALLAWTRAGPGAPGPEGRSARTRTPSGAAVLVPLALAGLLRPEAWLFAAVAWLVLAREGRRGPREERRGVREGRRGARELAGLALLAAAAPVLWALHDLVLAGDPLWSLTGTRENVGVLGRVTGLDDLPLTLPRRLGEILREPGLLAAAGGGVLSLLWLRRRALPGALAGLLAVGAFAVLAAAGLSLLVRYLLPAAAVLAVFAGAGLAGWRLLPAGDARRRAWLAFAGVCAVLLVAFAPAQARRLDRLQAALARQEQIVAALEPLARRAPCRPLAVPNRRAVPHLALWLDLQPRDVVVVADAGVPARGTYLAPTSRAVADDFVLDARDRDRRLVLDVPGAEVAGANAAWRAFARCGR